mgnify:CR=1 FL=1
MDDVLYLILVAVWVAFGFYQNARKQKKKAGTVPKTQPSGKPVFTPQPEKESDLEDVLGEILGIPKPEPVRPVTETVQPSPAHTMKYEPIESSPGMRTVPLMDQIKKPRYESIEFVELAELKGVSSMQDSGTGTSNPSIAFSLRHAVIYSAILNRPYA